jgi:hypothetical protein
MILTGADDKNAADDAIDIFSMNVPNEFSLMMKMRLPITLEPTATTSTASSTTSDWANLFQYGKFLLLKAGRILEAYSIFGKIVTALQPATPASSAAKGEPAASKIRFHLYCHAVIGMMKGLIAAQDKKSLEKVVEERLLKQSSQIKDRMLDEIPQIAFHFFLGQVYFFHAARTTHNSDHNDKEGKGESSRELAKRHFIKALFLDEEDLIEGYDVWTFITDFHVFSLSERQSIFQKLHCDKSVQFTNNKHLELYYRSKIGILSPASVSSSRHHLLQQLDSPLIIVNQVQFAYQHYDYQTCIDLLQK